MQAQEEFVGSNDRQALIMKGRRTKRQRSSSPFGVTVTSSSSSACGGGVAEEYNLISSPTTTSGEIYESTEEEEDMANCLIMLAHSDGPKRSVEEKFKNQKLYVYECKACDRSFPSFQALGGHMASHKKSKGAAMAEDKKPPVLAVNDHDAEEEGAQFNKESPAVLAFQVNNNKANCHGNKGNNKIHECSICGSEFTSGQALGGHMRRHRAAAAAASSNQAAMNVDIKPRNILYLDLNLPAPEADLRDSKFQFATPQQAIVFSTPALVDCHY